MAQITIQDVASYTDTKDMTAALRGQGRKFLAAKVRQDLGLVPSSEDAAARQKTESELGARLLGIILARPAPVPAVRKSTGKAEKTPAAALEPAATA